MYLKSGKKQTLLLIIEPLILSLIVFIVNLLLFPDNPGFISLYSLPYLVGALFFAAYGGMLAALLCLGLSLVLITLAYPFLMHAVTGFALDGYWVELYHNLMVPVAVFLVLIYVFATMQKNYTETLERYREKFRKLGGEKHLLSNKAKALEAVNEELEERVSRQQESITALYNQLQKVETVSVSAVLDVLLETVQIFTKAHTVTVWRYNSASEELQLVSALGTTREEAVETEIPVENSIEGWVLRNNQFFSVRMLLGYENLKRLDTGRNILTIPIHHKTRIWGVLNIEEMPFTKYNLYTEQLLFIIISLIEPALEKAIEYESIIQREEIDTETGLPLFSSFYKMLGEELKRQSLEQSTLSVVILELINYPDLVQQFSEHEVRALLSSIAKTVNDSTNQQGQAFHFKQENQLAFLFSNLDFDGASLFCLEILEKMNEPGWVITHEPIALEVITGFSSYTGNETGDELIEKAQNLLEMQKL